MCWFLMIWCKKFSDCLQSQRQRILGVGNAILALPALYTRLACPSSRFRFIRKENLLYEFRKTNQSRDYLYGRLTHKQKVWSGMPYICKMAKSTYSSNQCGSYLQQFTTRPYSTWLNIESVKLVPYKNYWPTGKDFYKQAIGKLWIYSKTMTLCAMIN